MTKNPIVLDQVFKSYTVGKQKVEAVTDISFEVNKGELF